MTPRELGYIFPAEWEQHDAIFLSWPHDELTFPNMEKTEQAYVEIIKSLRGSEKVNLLVTKENKERVLSLVKRTGNENVEFFVHDYADVWFRDYGPTFVANRKEKKLAIVKWKFNAWGNKYEALLKDDDIPVFINKKMKLPFFEAGIVMEGGSIDANGKGSLLTTRECLLNENRNPGLTQKQIEKKLMDFLGISNIIWLDKGVEGDDTDAHIDNLARFVNENTIVCPLPDKNDSNYANLKENYDILKHSIDQDGKTFNIATLPLPKVEANGTRLPASYCNFYIANRTILLPVFGVPEDEKATSTMKKLFPSRTISPINCRELVAGFGAIHCISQQQPKV